MDKFRLVFNPNHHGTSPSVRHYNVNEAKAEAERLCRKERCQMFVMEAVAAVAPEPPVKPPVKWTEITT